MWGRLTTGKRRTRLVSSVTVKCLKNKSTTSSEGKKVGWKNKGKGIRTKGLLSDTLGKAGWRTHLLGMWWGGKAYKGGSEKK